MWCLLNEVCFEFLGVVIIYSLFIYFLKFIIINLFDIDWSSWFFLKKREIYGFFVLYECNFMNELNKWIEIILCFWNCGKKIVGYGIVIFVLFIYLVLINIIR